MIKPRTMIRAANTEDAAIVEQILTSSRAEYLPYAKSPHTREETRHWVGEILIPSGGVVIALSGDEEVAVLATSISKGVGWIDQLYVLPGFTGEGIGSELLSYAQNCLPGPIRLWTFQENHAAIRFYQRHGFRAIKYTNGESNEEQCPDVLFELV